MIPYTYRCDNCGNVEDFYYSMSDTLPKEKECSKCGKITMHRVYNAVFKIPFQWNQDTFDFTKRPRERRKYR